uniref:Uncharacterized protein n=1 Tax=Rangifer tarandus platyrhynchus TaxID=3082113 RepID=A0ACB0FEB3_RANTA|nr:unnamed protein product [Rangifer tarandus platyrhynchus]
MVLLCEDVLLAASRAGGASTLLGLLCELRATAELKAPRSSPVLCKEEASELVLGLCSELLPPRPHTGPPSTAFSPHLGLLGPPEGPKAWEDHQGWADGSWESELHPLRLLASISGPLSQLSPLGPALVDVSFQQFSVDGNSSAVIWSPSQTASRLFSVYPRALESSREVTQGEPRATAESGPPHQRQLRGEAFVLSGSAFCPHE